MRPAVASAEVGTLGSGARAALPIVLGYLSIGFAAGVVQRASGLSVIEVVLMSLVLYAGSAQFVVAGLIAAARPGELPVATIVATVFLVNLRHVLLSAALAPHFTRVSAIRNALLGLQLTDETFVVAWTALARGVLPDAGRAAWMAGLNLSAYFSWALANLAAWWGTCGPSDSTLHCRQCSARCWCCSCRRTVIPWHPTRRALHRGENCSGWHCCRQYWPW